MNAQAPVDQTTTTPVDPVVPPQNRKASRRRLLLIFGAVAGLVALIWWGWATFFTGDTVSTENAYTAVEVAQVTPAVGGPVAQVRVTDTQAVRAGAVLVTLDDTDARLAVAQAEANLARTERNVRQLFANDDSLAGRVDARGADIASAEADLARARADLTKAEADVGRRRTLAERGVVSQETLTNAEAALGVARASITQSQARIAAARSARTAAAGERQANAALIEGASVANHPDVLAARARLDQARTDLARTVIRAPVDGVVSQRTVEVGQRVQPGQRLMTVVPVERLYVDANFKESQLREVRPGQRVHLTSDLYGDAVVYEGRVIGFAGGSGSAFAAIPAQNATGNWIKVVQRLPVRIALDPAELRAHPLRVGLSMHATVDLASDERAREVAAR